MHVAILGNGISGITAARFLRKLGNYRITVISSESDYFWSRTALMYIYMGHMRLKETQPYEHWFWEKNNIDLIRGRVCAIDFDHKRLHFDDRVKHQSGSTPDTLDYDKLILAVGSQPNKFGWPGQDLAGVSGMYSLQDLEQIEFHTRKINQAVIVGGGLIGIELAEMLLTRNIPVTFLVRESSFWNRVLPAEESDMVNRHIREHGVDLRLKTELKEILPDKNGKCRAVLTSENEEIPCGFVGLTAGVSPNISWLKGGPLETEKGIRVDAYLQTNIPDVYAIGDCAEIKEPMPGRRPIEAVWYTGKKMGETVAYNIAGHQIPYDPGVWFNSAKFMDIEYQVYGDVPAQLPDEQESLYWEHRDGRKSIRINYLKSDGRILGFNLMGVRYRHEVCEKWIEQGAHIEEVLSDLKLANFDPEFYDEYEEQVLELYHQKTGNKVSVKSNRKWSKVLAFLKN